MEKISSGWDAGGRRGAAFYDDPECFDRYQRHRAWSLSPNAVMEGPALFEELGPVAGLRGAGPFPCGISRRSTASTLTLCAAPKTQAAQET